MTLGLALGRLGLLLFSFCLINRANLVGLEGGILATSRLAFCLHPRWAPWAGWDQFLPLASRELGHPTWVSLVVPETAGLASAVWVMDGGSYCGVRENVPLQPGTSYSIISHSARVEENK